MLYIGPHVSAAQSVALSPLRAKDLGATGFALFTKNQRQWRSTMLKDEDISLFKANMDECGYAPSAVLPHAGYLINPASPDPELWEKSLNLFLDEAGRTVALGLEKINIHPGAYKEGEKIDGIKRSALMMDRVLDAYPSIHIAVENTAGAGTIIGDTMEDLDAILSFVKNKDRLGFTLDTAHLYGAGYDVKNDADGILDQFFSRFGEGKLYGMHLNDS
ncbi:MAG: deoxyribonuclease IV, partial [Candidatus Ornithospirochaeta sp.]